MLYFLDINYIYIVGIDKSESLKGGEKEFGEFNFHSEDILENLEGDQQRAVVSILEGIALNNKESLDINLETTKSGLIKIAISPKSMELGKRKTPISIVVKKDGKVNLNINQREHYEEFYYNQLNVDYPTIVYYIGGFNDILEGKTPDEAFGKHEFVKHSLEVPGSDIDFYHQGKHMGSSFKSKNERFNSGEFDSKK